ncbi:hypothetical protein BB561_006072 [Smittium simulii]|uniref:Peptidase S1 domain-containing protein n=1 Tax=Smittium simulii TaxID=133385 RepID=A0A2T9Y6P6_9FUNG|nr:hypothetical protein BB561_006072 [Smittium simulii]
MVSGKDSKTSDELGNLRILHGDRANFKDFPFIVQFMQKNGDKTRICTGSLITSSHIITAAHCFRKSIGENYPLESIKAYYGSDRSAFYNKDIIPHNLSKVIFFDKGKEEVDIAVVILEKKVDDPRIIPISLYKEAITDDLDLTVAGFGTTSSTEIIPSSFLKKVKVNLSSSSNCKKFEPSWTNNNGILICSEPKENKDACEGDSGGPLVILVDDPNNKNKKIYALVGTVSFGLSKKGPAFGQCGKDTVSYYINANSALKSFIKIFNQIGKREAR